jgi:hypothetical protein
MVTCLVGLQASGAGTVVLAENCKGLNDTVQTFLLADTAARIGAANCLSYSAVSFVAKTAGVMWFQNSAAVRGTDGIVADEGGQVRAVGVTLEDMSGAAIRTGPTGTNTIVGAGITCFSNTLDLQQQAAGSLIELGASFMQADKFDVQDWEDITVTYDGQEQGRYLVQVAKDLSVGLPEFGRHTYMGEGEAYTRGMQVLTSDATASAVSDGGNLTDVSAAARSISSSTFTFQGTSQNHTILLGSDLANGDVQKHFGIWMKQTVAAVEVTPKSFVWEVWDGAAWTEVATMAFRPRTFYTYANSLFLRVAAEEFIHIGVQDATTWAKKTISGHNLYWSRIRIATTITTAPVFEQFRLLPNHATVHDEGTVTFHGAARFERTLVGLGNIFGEEGNTVDVSIPVGSGGVPTGWSHNCKNSQFNNAGDALDWQFPIPLGSDTSLPLTMGAVLVPDSGGAGTVVMSASLLATEVAGVMVADPTGGTTPVARTLSNTEALTSKAAQTQDQNLTSGVTDKPQRVEFGPFDIADYYPGDMIFLRLEMDDSGVGNAKVTTLVAEVSGSQWNTGRKN